MYMITCCDEQSSSVCSFSDTDSWYQAVNQAAGCLSQSPGEIPPPPPPQLWLSSGAACVSTLPSAWEVMGGGLSADFWHGHLLLKVRFLESVCKLILYWCPRPHHPHRHQQVTHGLYLFRLILFPTSFESLFSLWHWVVAGWKTTQHFPPARVIDVCRNQLKTPSRENSSRALRWPVDTCVKRRMAKLSSVSNCFHAYTKLSLSPGQSASIWKCGDHQNLYLIN